MIFVDRLHLQRNLTFEVEFDNITLSAIWMRELYFWVWNSFSLWVILYVSFSGQTLFLEKIKSSWCIYDYIESFIFSICWCTKRVQGCLKTTTRHGYRLLFKHDNYNTQKLKQIFIIARSNERNSRILLWYMLECTEYFLIRTYFTNVFVRNVLSDWKDTGSFAADCELYKNFVVLR